MTAQFARAPFQGRPTSAAQSNPQAALLIDFDNVTMGIRSDLTKELKNLLNSDVIKGKVAVQRAYADWRRYPQYVVSLAEASVDLIFAPAYGSVKKNATDIRLAIDALELVFTRPEIGTFILLSGDSDFSSLVLKLKEYGKYVVGVGIRESASDLLVQNCDEYYSYSALTGLTRTGDEGPAVAQDPWELVELAVRQMVAASDVMRSDRLKQVLLEMDPNFNEKTLGFVKFNRFVQEAANKGLLKLHKLENGQFELALPDAEEAAAAVARASEEERPDGRRRSRRGRGRREERRDEPVEAAAASAAPAERELPAAEELPHEPASRPAEVRADLNGAYVLLRRAVGETARGGGVARDSDVKRRILELDPDWDESTLGFSKFSRFLRQAHEAEIVNLTKLENGSYEITLGDGAPARTAERTPEPPARREEIERAPRARDRSRPEPPRAEKRAETEARVAPPPRPPAPPAPAAAPAASAAAPKAPAAATPPAAGPTGVPRALGLRRGSRGRSLITAPPPLLQGQAIAPAVSKVAEPPKTVPAAPGPASKPAAEQAAPRARTARPRKDAGAPKPAVAQPAPRTIEPAALGFPTRAVEVVTYLATQYKGIGQKMAESLIDAFGAAKVFQALLREPERVKQILGERRGEKLIQAWHQDYDARFAAQVPAQLDTAAQNDDQDEPPESGPAPNRRRGRRGGRRRRGVARQAE
jgi:uncharacterized protein (TIGR00288 family)